MGGGRPVGSMVDTNIPVLGGQLSTGTGPQSRGGGDQGPPLLQQGWANYRVSDKVFWGPNGGSHSPWAALIPLAGEALPWDGL